MKLESTYKDGERLPVKYANVGVEGGKNISPSFCWEGAPEETKSYALAMIDHAPVAKNFVHWLVIDIPAAVRSIDEGASLSARMPTEAKELNSTYGPPGYGGGRPPAGTGDHPYETTIYALNVPHLGLAKAVTRNEFKAALEGKVLDSAKLTGMLSQ